MSKTGTRKGRKEISQPFPATSSILYLRQPRMLGKDVVMFNAAMGACEKASAWQTALCLFNGSPSPDVISYNCLMSTLFAERLAGMCKEADRVFRLQMTSGIFRYKVTPRLSGVVNGIICDQHPGHLLALDIWWVIWGRVDLRCFGQSLQMGVVLTSLPGDGEEPSQLDQVRFADLTLFEIMILIKIKLGPLQPAVALPRSGMGHLLLQHSHQCLRYLDCFEGCRRYKTGLQDIGQLHQHIRQANHGPHGPFFILAKRMGCEQINSSQTPNLSAMAKSEEKSSNWQLALSFLSQAGSRMADLISFNAAISACEHFALQSVCLFFWVQTQVALLELSVPLQEITSIYIYI